MASLHFMEYNERLYLNINVEYYINTAVQRKYLRHDLN